MSTIVSSSTQGLPNKLPSLPVIEHPALRRLDTDNAELRIQGSCRQDGVLSAGNLSDKKSLPPLRAGRKHRKRGKEHSRVLTWPTGEWCGTFCRKLPWNYQQLFQALRSLFTLRTDRWIPFSDDYNSYAQQGLKRRLRSSAVIWLLIILLLWNFWRCQFVKPHTYTNVSVGFKNLERKKVNKKQKQLWVCLSNPLKEYHPWYCTRCAASERFQGNHQTHDSNNRNRVSKYSVSVLCVSSNAFERAVRYFIP